MTNQNILDGKKCAQAVYEKLSQELKNNQNQQKPGLATVLVGNNPASQVYIRHKIKACEKLGIVSFHHDLPEDTTQKELLDLVARLNSDPKVHGILVQLPLPKGIDEALIIQTIDPKKDVDGFHPENVGRLLLGQEALFSCTPFGVMKLLAHNQIEVFGKHAVIVGRSNIVGKPLAMMLLAQNATVTICHSKTQNIAAICAQADILVAAVGRPKMVKASWVKPKAVVVDVGINRLEDGSLCGDVDFDEVSPKASWITPVPGGVGPMTIATLLANTVAAFQKHSQ